MLIEKRKPGYLDSDSDAKLFDDQAWLNAMNCRNAVTQFGRAGRWENCPGTTLISQSVFPPYGVQQCIGGCVDTENEWLIFCEWNSFDDHGIYMFDFRTEITYPVLYDSQTTDGLGFSKNFRIDRNCRVVNGVFYWTDNNAQPRKVNIRAGVNLNRPGTFPDAYQYTGGIDENIITVIRKPPNYSLSVEKFTQSGTVNSNQLPLFAGKFSAFYNFIDNEISVLSAYSQLVNYNFKADPYNCIDISFSFSEKIPQDVQRVQMAVQFGLDPNFFVIKIWDKDNATDLQEINDHNNGVQELIYRFYNDQTGIPLDGAYSVKPFDSVPLISKTIETVRNRLHLGNNTEGYDSPTITSLTAGLITETQGADAVAYVVRIFFDPIFGGTIPKTRFALRIPSLSTTNYFCILPGTSSTFPNPTNYTTLTQVATGGLQGFYSISGSYNIFISDTGDTVSLTNSPSPVTLANALCYKSGAAYKIAIVFFDRWMRKSGVIINNEIYITPNRSYSSVSYTTSIDWLLSNGNAVNEIPDWAEYYAVVRTKCLRTTYFLQARSRNLTSSMSYVTKDADNLYVFATSAYSSSLAGVAVDITNLTNFGMGYTFSEGDLIKVYISSSVYTLRIIAQDGRWLVCELQNLGALTATTDALFEIYTPYTPSINEAYYEVGQIYAVLNPGTPSREYSVTGGSIRGDVYLLDRSGYLTENMSPNETYWQNWYTDAGRPNFIDTIGQVEKPTSISYSNIYIPGTRTNGLSSFDALDEASIPQECGAIQKLQVANKVTEEGNIMLAICRTQTVSLYMGEVQLVGQASNAFIAQAPNVIGTMNVLKGNYGTMNPESVVEYMGLVFWIDILNGCFIQYSGNGLEPVSRYKMSRFFKNYGQGYLATNNNNLDNINGFHHIPTCVDVFHKEVICTLPGFIYSNYANTLPSYSSVPDYATSIVDRFDIYDELGKTMVFKFEENIWGNNFEYMGEFYDYFQNTMVGFKNGYLYKFNSNTTNWNTFFSIQYPMRICTTGNLNPSLLKDLFGISIEGSGVPGFTVAMANFPWEQITDLASTDEAWVNDEGVWYASFLGDRLDPNQSGTADQKLFTGSNLKDFAIYIMCEWQKYDGLMYVNFINLGYDQSKGQSNITNVINK